MRQFHPGLKVSQIKELPKGDFLINGDSVQDVLILQSENKMKAALGQNVKVSLPKVFQTNKQQAKSLAVKGVPSDISDSEFKEPLGLNKINFSKAERLKSKKDGRVLPIFRLLRPYRSRGSHFSKFSLPSNRHSVQGGGISNPHFSYAVLQLPMFGTFSKNL